MTFVIDNGEQYNSTFAFEIWKDESAIHEMFAEELSKVEFKYFVSLGVLFGANPFAGEIWAVKYDKIGKDFVIPGRCS